MPHRHLIALLCCSLALGACGASQVDLTSPLAHLAPISDASASLPPAVVVSPPDPASGARIGRNYVLDVRRAAHRYEFALQACEGHPRDARADCVAAAQRAFAVDRAAAHRTRITGFASLR